jgi:hypothetical protein
MTSMCLSYSNRFYSDCLKSSRCFSEKFYFKVNKSSYALEFAGICDYFLKLVIKLVYIDSHILLVKSDEGTEFAIEFFDFIKKVIENPVSPRWSEQAIQITLILNKEYTTYSDELDIIKKKEILGAYIDRTLPTGTGRCNIYIDELGHVLNELKILSRYLIQDFIFNIDPQQNRNRGSNLAISLFMCWCIC